MEERFLCFSERCQGFYPAFLQLEQLLFLAASWGVWCGGTNVYCGVWWVLPPKFIVELKSDQGVKQLQKRVFSQFVLPVDFFVCVCLWN